MSIFSKLFGMQKPGSEKSSPTDDYLINIKKQESSSSSPMVETEGALPGIFSVSPLTKVKFSKGNLLYKASDNSWHFAEHQYDIIGEKNALISPINYMCIDLFCWGSSGFNNVLPYIGDNGNPFFYDCDRKDITSTRYDWGINNFIENGGNKPGLWRTLSKDEWKYLLQERDNASKLYAFGKIAGICGLILLPDGYKERDIVFGLNDFDSNIITVEDWDKLEMNGAVFLPCAGHRGSGTQIYHINVSGRYWSTSIANSAMAYCFCIENKFLNAEVEEFRESGISVRLVTNS